MAYNPNPPYPMPQMMGGGDNKGQPYPGGGPGYPPTAPMGFDGPPPGYSYPPVPIPVVPEYQYQPTGPIMNQPVAGGGGYYPPPPQGYPPPSYGPGGYSQPPIQMQPQAQQAYGQTVPLNVPPGLEYLTQIDRVFIKQKVELLEAFLGFETKNKYKIKNSQGQVIFTAKEDTDCCTRNCCGPYRPFDIKIKDNNEREIIHLNRPFAFDSCFCPCWLQSLEVFSPPGQLAGTICQEWSICEPKYSIKNASGETVLTIQGPFCTMSICGTVEFQIMSADGSQQVGKISKEWSGLIREAFTDADNFGISFPMDLDVRMKATMIGACFLIDFMFFEKARNKEGDRPGMF